MYRYVLVFLSCYGTAQALFTWPSFQFARTFGREFGGGLGESVAEGILSKSEGPIKSAGAAVKSVIDESLPKINVFTKETLSGTDRLLDKSAHLFQVSMRTVADLFNKSVYTAAGVAFVSVIGLTVFRRWYNKEKKYTLPKAHAAQSWTDIIEPACIRDTLLQKVQFINLVRSARQNSGYGLYRPLLLSGEHGTGKSAIAQLIARESGMKATYISSAHFMQYTPEKCFAELYHLFADATAQTEQLIVIDNVDDFLVLHDTVFVNKLIQLFVEVMSVNKTHCMIIGITRNSLDLPPALKNCFDDTIELMLPDYAMRKEMLLHYRNVYNEKYKHILKKPLSEHLTDEELDVLARSSEGVSGAQLEGMVSEAVIQATMS